MNYTDFLPQKQCPIDANDAMRQATLIAGQDVVTPLVVVTSPNGTYTCIVGYCPGRIAKALGDS